VKAHLGEFDLVKRVVEVLCLVNSALEWISLPIRSPEPEQPTSYTTSWDLTSKFTGYPYRAPCICR
jgi:hypothetical protein